MRRRIICSLVACVLAVGTAGYSAPPVPPLRQLVAESRAACDALPKFDEEKPFAETYFAWARLSAVYLRIGNQNAALEIWRDKLKWKDPEDVVADLAVEFGGTPPATLKGDAGTLLVKRRSLAMLLTKRNDYAAAAQQIELLPEHPQRLDYAVQLYCDIAERQIERGELSAAQKSAGAAWKLISQFPATDKERRAWRMLRLAKICVQLHNVELGRRVCERAEQAYDEYQRDASLKGAKYEANAYRGLASAYGEIGESERARDFLRKSLAAVKASGSAPRDLFELYLTLAEIEAKLDQKDRALAAYEKALEIARQLDHREAEAFAEKLDPSGMVSGFLELGRGSEFAKVGLGQLKVGDRDAAFRTLGHMPLSMQKLRLLAQMAKFFQSQGRKEEARDCGNRCLALVDKGKGIDEQWPIYAIAAAIFQQVGDEATARRTLADALAASEKQAGRRQHPSLAGEMADLGLLADAYQVIQQIERLADRALPLVRLTEKLAELEQARVSPSHPDPYSSER